MKSRRNIVFINQATGYLTIDIINAFAESKDFGKVALIAGSIRIQDIPLNEKVAWSRITLYDRGTPTKKLISWIKGSFQILYLLLTRYRKFEVFYITIPPFAYLLSLFISNRFSILVFDVYPDVLQVFNINPDRVIYRLWTKWNKKLFKDAYRLYTIGEGMAKLMEQYVERSKITIIPNWTGLTKVKEISKGENFFIRQQRLEGKFIIQYSGNIGYTHNVEILVEIAHEMVTEESIFFLIIGRGEKYKEIDALVSRQQLKNCRVLPFQPDEMLNNTLSAADIGVVLLDDKSAHVSIPSKIYNLQAAGVPILGIADVSSELSIHLNRYENGKCFNPNDKQEIIDFIKRTKSDTLLRDRLQKNSRVAGRNHTYQNATLYLDKYLDNNL